MNGKGYKLSIIIPTYNGGKWIEPGIISIAEQVQHYLNEVEFIVRDNCSTDDTENIVRRMQEQYPGVIKYDRRKENAADLDVNFQEAISLSSGEYFMLIGDDDALFPNAISYFISLIEHNSDVSLFYFNRIVTNYKFEKARLRDVRKIGVNENVIYSGVLDFLKSNINGPDFISVNIIRRSSYEESCDLDTDLFYGYKWYARYLWGVRNDRVMHVSFPLVVQRLPLVRSWGQNSVLYIIVGLSNLFKGIDDSGELYRIWIDYLHEENRMNLILSGLTTNKPLYLKQFTQITMHLNKSERIKAWLLLHVSCYKYYHNMNNMIRYKLKKYL